MEWAPQRIHVNTISPGPIAGTEGVRKLYEDRGGALDLQMRRVALGRVAKCRRCPRRGVAAPPGAATVHPPQPSNGAALSDPKRRLDMNSVAHSPSSSLDAGSDASLSGAKHLRSPSSASASERS